MESMINFYPCLSIKETTNFYQNILKMKIYSSTESSVIFDSGYGYLGFVRYDSNELATKTCISFNLESKNAVDEKYQDLQKYELEFTCEPVKHAKYDVYSFFMKDPNGYNVEFQKILM